MYPWEVIFLTRSQIQHLYLCSFTQIFNNNLATAQLVVLVVKNLPANAGDVRLGFDPWVRKIPWRRAWQCTSVFLPGESHGQGSLAGYSPQGVAQSQTRLKRLSTHTMQLLLLALAHIVQYLLFLTFGLF